MIGQKKKILALNRNEWTNTTGHDYWMVNDDEEAEGGDGDCDSDGNNYNSII